MNIVLKKEVQNELDKFLAQTVKQTGIPIKDHKVFYVGPTKPTDEQRTDMLYDSSYNALFTFTFFDIMKQYCLVGVKV